MYRVWVFKVSVSNLHQLIIVTIGKNIYLMVATNVLTISGGAVVDAVAVADNSLGGVGFVADSGSLDS